jgi:2-polyprenyl-3-methyl-5-hydroxy-6-metoxy-1,4-benzoquinol methylase
MSRRDRWQERYQNEDTPWETNRPDSHIIQLVKEQTLTPCTLLEIGCGTGSNAIWLASKGFKVTAIDISATAINRAQLRMAESGVQCEFQEADFINTQISDLPFQWVFDRGCFHCCATVAERKQFAANVARHLTDDGLWLSLIGSADDPPRDTGPPMLKAMEVLEVLEPLFEVLRLDAIHFDSNRIRPPKAWFCLVRKRPH